MNKALTISLAGLLPLAVGACEVAPKTSSQNGYSGTGMDTIMIADSAVAEEVPSPPYDPPGLEGTRAGDRYENLQVLGDLSEDQFNYTMAAITEWVSPEEGCNYCHNPADMASDELYTKVVSRRMLEMTRALNADWTSHVKQTGVTCWTCHRGENIPSETWTLPSPHPNSIVNNRSGQNEPVSNSAYSSLPNSAVVRYLLGGTSPDQAARVVSTGIYPGPENRTSTMEAENTYAMMMHISQALGVNCTYCHNSQSFQSWATSNPPRETAWQGLEMVRAINFGYISPLADTFPPNRLGPEGDPLKVNCTTCHRGQNLPLGGVSMVRDYPALIPALTPSAPAAAAPAEESEAAGDEGADGAT